MQLSFEMTGDTAGDCLTGNLPGGSQDGDCGGEIGASFRSEAELIKHECLEEPDPTLLVPEERWRKSQRSLFQSA